jgi:ATP-dependent exoDNAse (exonuclease V) beta subunit
MYTRNDVAWDFATKAWRTKDGLSFQGMGINKRIWKSADASETEQIEAWRKKIGDKAADAIMLQAQERGIAFHSLLEQLAPQAPSVTLEQFCTSEAILPEAKELGWSLLTSRFLENQQFINAEIFLHGEIGGKACIGFADQLMLNPQGKYCIVDWKTKANRAKWRPPVQRAKMQLACYATLMYKAYGLCVDSCAYVTCFADGSEAEVTMIELGEIGELLGLIKAEFARQAF